MKKSVRIISLFLAAITVLGVFLSPGFAEDEPGVFDYKIIDGKAYIDGYSGSERDLVIPEKVKATGSEELTEVVGVNFIEFNPDFEFDSISFPKTVEKIEFENGILCKSFYVDAENPVYKSSDGVLYSKDGAVLVRYPCLRAEKTFTVPAETLIIDVEAFKNSVNLETVVLEGIIARIDTRAFSGCVNLKEVKNLPVGFDTVGPQAFEGCENLESFTGETLSGFSAIGKEIYDIINDTQGALNVLSSIINRIFGGGKNKSGRRNGR